MANENWKKLEPSKRQRLEEALKWAQECQRKTGVLASITVAQWAVESAWGTRHMGDANNYFGMKPGSSWKGKTVTLPTKEFLDGKWITVEDKFRAFSSPEACFVSHGEFLLKPRYAPCFQYPAGTKDGDRYKWFAQKIWECGYATAPDYPKLLTDVIMKYGLFYYDIGEEEIQAGLKAKKKSQ